MADPNIDEKDQNVTDFNQEIEGGKGGYTSQDQGTDISSDTDVVEFPEVGSVDDQSEPTSRKDQ